MGAQPGDRLVLTRPQALAAAAELASGPRRRILGLAGPPGAGKSTLAAEIEALLGPERAVTVGMDAFHLAQVELERLGRAGRKGAPDTFDVGGLVALLRRLRAADEPVVHAPVFHRELEDSIAAQLAVPAAVPLVLVEGNYLLLPDPGWAEVRPLLDVCWYLALDDAVRRERLVARHGRHGRDPEQARRWALGSDQRNAELVAAHRDRADAVVDLSPG